MAELLAEARRAPKDFESLKATITDRYGELSGQLKRIAEFALDRPDDLALATVSSVAQSVGVQPSSVVRFAKAFGYDGFSEMQQLFRQRLIAASPSYRERIRSFEGGQDQAAESRALLNDFVEQGTAALALLQDPAIVERLDAAVDLLSAARTVLLLGQQRAFPVAFYLSYALGRLERPSLLLEGVGGLLRQQAAFAGPEDAIVAASFRPYTPEVVEIVTERRAAGIPAIAITDSALSPIAREATLSFELQEPEDHGFRTLVAPILLAQVLVVGLGHRLAGTDPRSPQ